ncbi:MAG: hypothetical protein CMF70_04460 [Magnetovibrio sp.]|nr:hypothetical protein [Magnetovibrio sp.]
MTLTVRNILLLIVVFLLVFLLPVIVYASLVWLQFGFLKISGYIPIEELSQALAALSFIDFFSTPMMSINMTSGLILSNVYSLTSGQFILTAAMGLAILLNLIIYLDQRQCDYLGSRTGVTAAAGTGLLATVSASSTGIVGCCGVGFSGGLLALTGIGASASRLISENSSVVQIILILLFLINWFRLRRKLEVPGTKFTR